jgi:glycosyltransferase involved in cell wall biosynthesis
MSITVVILTKNEELHIGRALASVTGIASRCVVVDSGSSDRTVEIARAAGAEVLSNPFTTQAQQFNWALEQLPSDTEWVLRLDADEFATEALATEISEKLSKIPNGVAAVCISRRMNFLGRPVKWGGLFPVRVVRLFKYGRGRSEDRWMDEHITADGVTVDFQGEIIDDNLNSLTWWVEKHNSYASREVVELLDLEYSFMERDSSTTLQAGRQAGTKRWLKEKVYARLPGGFRAFAYFAYRYIVRGGFIDSKEGAIFHVLQGFWYRYLVDAKLHEVNAYMRKNNVDAISAIKDVLGIDVQR